MEIVIPSQEISDKLAKRQIDEFDIRACLANREGTFVEETKLTHITNPASYWFIAEDDKGRILKISFMYYTAAAEMHIKSAFEASEKQINEYKPYLK